MGRSYIEGHRERARRAYLNSSIKYMSEHHILELILFYAIPRRDVKPLAFEMVQRFGSLKNVLNADMKQLTAIDGVGENTALLIKLIGDISRLQAMQRNDSRIRTSGEAEEYAHSILYGLPLERLILISLDDQQQVIQSKIIAEGDCTEIGVDPKKVVESVISCNAKNVILAHNHPNAGPVPSPEDVEFTVEVLNLLRAMHIKLNDHIIVGDSGTRSMGDMLQYANFFDK